MSCWSVRRARPAADVGCGGHNNLTNVTLSFDDAADNSLSDKVRLRRDGLNRATIPVERTPSAPPQAVLTGDVVRFRRHRPERRLESVCRGRSMAAVPAASAGAGAWISPRRHPRPRRLPTPTLPPRRRARRPTPRPRRRPARQPHPDADRYGDGDGDPSLRHHLPCARCAEDHPGNNAARGQFNLVIPPGYGTIGDLDLVGLNITHTYIGDLIVKLTSPGGTTVTLINRICNAARAQNFNNTSLDDGAALAIGSSCPPTTNHCIPA